MNFEKHCGSSKKAKNKHYLRKNLKTLCNKIKFNHSLIFKFTREKEDSSK